jgi:quercetin dioxygenase-like cupin family protein
MTGGGARVVGLDGAETITARETRDVVILLDSPELTVTWSRYGPGERGPDLHLHHRHTDAFYVLEGELTFDLGPGPERSVLPAGGYVAVPPDVAHSFFNAGPGDVRWLNLHAPDAGFAVYMRGLRDKVKTDFDSADVEPGGGRPLSEVVRGLPGAHPQLRAEERTLAGSETRAAAHRCTYWVLDGTLELRAGGEELRAAAGTLVSVPPALEHTLGGGVRVLAVDAPAS